ncbi:MAG: hypothetical protein IKY59_03365 [Oscillospiraceae bacterium]|nr:hypothetical protein [Oscillospiraceae bacterium]
MHKKVEAVFRKILHWLEGIIAAITLIVMVAMIFQEIYHMFTVDTYFSSLYTFLHSFLNILVGLEFVRMLIDLTPGNTIEVLIVALARQVIISHEDPISNICCVLCIAGLFATRHFLIPRKEINLEMSELAPDEGAEDVYQPH